MKHLYADDPVYQEVSHRLASIRQRFQQTVAAHLLPPSQRTKARYQNLRPIAEYGQHILAYLSRPHDADPKDLAFREAMAWVPEHQAFFTEMDEVTTVVCDVERLVKWHGLSTFTVNQCCQRLSQISTEKGMQPKCCK